jgi:AcrR family transcriptional regulator
MNKSTQTKQHIIEAAFSTLNQNPRATLADVATQAGVGRATLHRHFSGREDLLHHMYSHALSAMEHISNEVTVDCQSYSEALQVMFMALISQGHGLAFIMTQPTPQSSDIRANMQRQNEELLALLRACRQEGLFKRQLSDDWIMTLFDHLIHAGWEWQINTQSDPELAAEQAWDAFIRSVQ